MTSDPLLALGEHPFLLVLDQLPVRSLFSLQRVSRTWNAFLSEHTGLWAGVLRREGVDLDEWRQVLTESKERQRIATWDRERREALFCDALAQIGHDVTTEDGEPLILGPEYQANDPGPEAFMDTEFASTAAEYRAACESMSSLPRESQLTTDKSHATLQHAWEQRYSFETLVNTPSFRLRRIYVDGPYLYAFSKAWKGQTEEEREDTEDVHVFDKYSGRLLLTLPGNRANAAHAVGAGYLLTSANAQGELCEADTVADGSLRK